MKDIELQIMIKAGRDGLAHDHPMVVAAHDFMVAKSYVKNNPVGMDAKQFFALHDRAVGEYKKYVSS